MKGLGKELADSLKELARRRGYHSLMALPPRGTRKTWRLIAAVKSEEDLLARDRIIPGREGMEVHIQHRDPEMAAMQMRGALERLPTVTVFPAPQTHCSRSAEEMEETG